MRLCLCEEAGKSVKKVNETAEMEHHTFHHSKNERVIFRQSFPTRYAFVFGILVVFFVVVVVVTGLDFGFVSLHFDIAICVRRAVLMHSPIFMNMHICGKVHFLVALRRGCEGEFYDEEAVCM